MTQATLKEWAMKNGMDADIKSMTQAEKAMLRYQYVLANTTAAQNDFSRTADSWANQIRILKQNFQQLGGIIGGSLINAFKPFVRTLNFVMQKVISFATTVTNALGAIFGWKFEVSGDGVADEWSDAASSADDLADSTGEAADNTKKMKNNLLAIDELNVLNPDDSDAGSGGSGSGAGGAGGGAGSGGLVQTDTIWKDFESNIKSLYQLGEYIRDALIGAMESIDWDNIYEKARNLGTGLAQFLNGLFAGSNGITLFGEVGKAIASALNTVIYAALAFGQEFDFKQFGYNIADGINNFFATFDFAALAETLNTWANGIWDVLATAIGNIDWMMAYNKIVEFLENIDIKTIAITIGMLSIKNILGANIASSALSFVGKSISQKIGSAIASSLGIEMAAGGGIGKVLTLAGKEMGSTLLLGAKAVLGNKEAELVFSNPVAAAASGIETTVNPIIASLSGIVGIVTGAGIAIWNFVSMWQNGFSIVKEAIMGIGIALAAIGAVILGAPALVAAVIAGIVAAVATIVIVIKDHWEEIVSFFTSTIPAWWNGTALPFIQSIPDKFMELVNNIATFISELPGKIGYWLGYAFGSFVSWIADTISFVTEKVPEIIDSIVKWFADLPDKIHDKFVLVLQKLTQWKDDAVSFVTEKVPEIANGIIDVFKNLPDNLLKIGEDAINGLWDGMKNTWDTVTTGISDFVSGITSGFKDGLDINSPSRVMAEIGGYTIAGFNNGIIENTQTTMNSIHEWISSIEAVLAPETWANIFNNIIRGFQYKWLEFRSLWNSNLNAWWSANVTPWFAVAKWTALGNNMKNGLYSGFKGIVQMVGSIMNSMIDIFNTGLSRIKNAMNGLISEYNSVAGELGVSKLPHVNVATISKVNIPKYEVGGFPEDGLFFANHNEMVGQFSNGKTAVANNEQIVAGIREGVKAAVAEVLAPYLSDIADSNREIAEKDTSFTVDGRELVKAINEREARNGFSFT